MHRHDRSLNRLFPFSMNVWWSDEALRFQLFTFNFAIKTIFFSLHFIHESQWILFKLKTKPPVQLKQYLHVKQVPLSAVAFFAVQSPTSLSFIYIIFNELVVIKFNYTFSIAVARKIRPLKLLSSSKCYLSYLSHHLSNAPSISVSFKSQQPRRKIELHLVISTVLISQWYFIDDD